MRPRGRLPMNLAGRLGLVHLRPLRFFTSLTPLLSNYRPGRSKSSCNWISIGSQLFPGFKGWSRLQNRSKALPDPKAAMPWWRIPWWPPVHAPGTGSWRCWWPKPTEAAGSGADVHGASKYVGPKWTFWSFLSARWRGRAHLLNI